MARKKKATKKARRKTSPKAAAKAPRRKKTTKEAPAPRRAGGPGRPPSAFYLALEKKLEKLKPGRSVFLEPREGEDIEKERIRVQKMIYHHNPYGLLSSLSISVDSTRKQICLHYAK